MRIFWLGMHNLLVRTELPRLRAMGFEVFNPPYLSRLEDQSAERNWDRDQVSTLPDEVFEKLSSYNFFYNAIAPDIAELLDTYFDAVIVTINPDWLTEVLRVYKKRILYRTYGQIYPLSEYLWNNGAARLILDHPDFHFVPFHELSVDLEHSWLTQRMSVVPYQIDSDVIALQDSWNPDAPRRQEIMLTCPNIENPFYHAHYKFLKQQFNDPLYRFYGVQFKHPSDPQVVGTLARQDYLRAYQDASGYLYTHGGPLVSYLPPIEMMTVGGPVLCLPHSLLARMLGPDAPGLAKDPEDARKKCSRIATGDRGYISEILASQQAVRGRYHPDFVNTIFDPTMKALLAKPASDRAPGLVVNSGAAHAPATPAAAKRIYVLFHFPGGIITRRDHLYLSAEGIPRVIRLMVDAIVKTTDHEVVVTTTYGNAPFTIGFFGAAEGGRVKVHVVDDIPAVRGATAAVHPARWKTRLAPLAGKIAWLHAELARISGITRRRDQAMRARLAARLSDTINADKACVGVLVPHYYLFPEATTLDAPLSLYLPDYTPHFFEGTDAFANEDIHAGIGKAIADKARVVITNSQFTRSYISDTALKVAQEKIRVFPLPNLNRTSETPLQPLASLVRQHVKVYTDGRPIVFYPTQNRPNKNIPLLLQIMAELISKHARRQAERGADSPAEKPPVLVLTCSLDDFPPARQEFQRLGLAPHVVFVSSATDADLRWIYEQAVCLALTTKMEGNFPPQVIEALAYGTPVVASRIPLITEELGGNSDHLLLAETGSLADFVAKIEYAMGHRAAVLERQNRVREQLMSARTEEKFNAAMLGVITELTKTASARAVEPPPAHARHDHSCATPP